MHWDSDMPDNNGKIWNTNRVWHNIMQMEYTKPFGWLYSILHNSVRQLLCDRPECNNWSFNAVTW